MRIYRTPIRESGDEHGGYRYHLLKSEAKKAFEDDNAEEEIGDEIEVFDVSINKHDIIAFLNNHCSYNDNG